jgi:hypothetical protein
MDMNKICATPMYKCAVCGGVYDSIVQRMNCEQTCLKKQEEEESKAAEAKKAAEYKARVEEVNMAFEKAYKLKDKLVADYGEYKYQRKCNNIDECNSLDDVFNFIFGV